uniref:Uncharacterized protein n=1 Tax=Siphoviridae sp. ctxMM9 TaxID=2827973 RepID=A0A8S5T5Y9_9CAUD|nr:MAG TPA: hypothetical protein [Siphoviridae sp. ctxMM9]
MFMILLLIGSKEKMRIFLKNIKTSNIKYLGYII